jgi:hypothetical protein
VRNRAGAARGDLRKYCTYLVRGWHKNCTSILVKNEGGLVECGSRNSMGSLIWIVTLKCYECGYLFDVKGVPTSRIQEAADSSKCPACGMQPQSEHLNGETIVRNSHEIIDLRRDADAR